MDIGREFYRLVMKKKEETESILDPAKEECIAWERAMKGNKPILDYKGKQMYKSVPVPPKPKVMYCPYCHGYKKFKKTSCEYGLEIKGCESCGISVYDFHVRTVNSLWKKLK